MLSCFLHSHQCISPFQLSLMTLVPINLEVVDSVSKTAFNYFLQMGHKKTERLEPTNCASVARVLSKHNNRVGVLELGAHTLLYSCALKL